MPAWLSFSTPFLQVYTPLWLVSCLILVCADLGTKKLITDQLNFNLGYHQFKWLPDFDSSSTSGSIKALSNSPKADGKNQINILGPDGRYIKFRLVFNDRFVFGLGPSWPILGFFLSLFATFFLLLYRWYNAYLGTPIAWLLVFSGALGNLIDKLFIKSLYTREWVLSLKPQKGYISGVVDFIECTWFGWDSFRDIFLLDILAMETWPSFNLADSMILIGISLLLISMRQQDLNQNLTHK